MKTTRKLLLSISIILFLLTMALTISTSFFNYHIVIGNCGTSQILAVLAGVDIIFILSYILLSNKLKKIVAIVSIIFMVLTEAIMLTMAFQPKYKYTHHPLVENYYAITVEEKTTHDQISLSFYKKVSGILYKGVYSTSFSGNKMQSYKSDDYTITFKEKYFELAIPSSSNTKILVPHKT